MAGRPWGATRDAAGPETWTPAQLARARGVTSSPPRPQPPSPAPPATAPPPLTATVQDRRARGRPTALALPLPQHRQDRLPTTLDSPAAPVVLHRLPGRRSCGSSRHAPPVRQPRAPAGGAGPPASRGIEGWAGSHPASGRSVGEPRRPDIAATSCRSRPPSQKATQLALLRHLGQPWDGARPRLLHLQRWRCQLQASQPPAALEKTRARGAVRASGGPRTREALADMRRLGVRGGGPP